jgi:hypothetical protein
MQPRPSTYGSCWRKARRGSRAARLSGHRSAHLVPSLYGGVEKAPQRECGGKSDERYRNEIAGCGR